MTVTTQRFAGGSLPQGLVWQSLSFLRCEWPFLFTGANRLRTRPFGEPAAMHLVRTDAEVLLSYADIISAEAVLAGDRIDVLGLSNVFTVPPYRGEGHASAIVAAAGRLIEESSADLAILFCKRELAGFYSAHGWESAPVGAIQSPSNAPVTMTHACSGRGAHISAGLTSTPLILGTAW